MEHMKHEAQGRQKHLVVAKYNRIYQAFNDLSAGLSRAQDFYSQMKSTVGSLSENVTSFVANRKSEGGDLLQRIENSRMTGTNRKADEERTRLNSLMERMALNGGISTLSGSSQIRQLAPQNASYQYPPDLSKTPVSDRYSQPVPAYAIQPKLPSPLSPGDPHSPATMHAQGHPPYNPASYGIKSPLESSPYPSQFHPPNSGFTSPPPQFQQTSYYLPPGYMPPPPPPGAPQPHDFGGSIGQEHVSGAYTKNPPPQTQHQQAPRRHTEDPWAGLSGW